MGRREMASLTAAAVAGCVLGGPQRAGAEASVQGPPAPAWLPFYGKNGQLQYLGFTEAEETYPVRFIEYLSRLLLNFDEASRELFAEDIAPIEVLPKAKRQKALFDQFVRFSTSVEYGLKEYNGTKGAAKLARRLAFRFRDNPYALQQVAFLFTLMDEQQPVKEITEIMRRWENATVDQIIVQDGGSGYTGDAPQVKIKDSYQHRVAAEAACQMRDTGRLLTVRLKSGGAGYITPPKVSFPGLGQSFATSLKSEVTDIKFRLPLAEAVVKEGKVVAVTIKDRGQGLVAASGSDVGMSTLRVAFQAADGELPVANAEAYAVLDRQVGAITMKSKGAGYTSLMQPTVEVEPPGDCGGDGRIGRQATAKAVLKKGPVAAVAKNATASAALYAEARAGPTIEDEEVNEMIKLYPATVSIVYSNETKKFVFSETSLLGNNITTPFGPISQFSRRAPLSKERLLDGGVYWRLAAAGAICASIGHGLLVPLDTVKTRLQTAPKGSYDGPVDAFVKVFRDEGGVGALLRGLQPEVVGFSIYGAISFGGTEFCRRFLAGAAGPENALLYQIPILMLGSALASVVAITLTCPFMAVKTRLIADESFAGGSLAKGFTRIVREEEWQPSLFGGLVPLLLKDVTFVLSKFVVFDIIKTWLFFYFPEARDSLSSTLLVSLLSGSLAGVVSAVTSQPGDYLFAKSSQDAKATLGSAWATYWSNAVNKGLWADILTGLPPRLVFSGALIALQFVIYDYLRVQLHVSPNELMEFLDVMATVGSTSS